ncbi:HpcH/HpaI aldolase/citrate lyase family protein [Hyphomonas polymorpha PS728]|uniref:HpcH/HpaI aldolase/citrate lyase family protein n=1 Tax=Hyphomonas polymorpha PS728 TaxID=1280954 RepID=A0A062VJ65_9PROT|nr:MULTISPECIES: CoA ester lyase [Hyphomonas]AXE63686.1 aldolase [Hyphomonas sp. CACIAM 19H1]KCZ98136.1 HpcH/HpaI aldolase/citrate lyase family protein [Hyphomonas polymorpha PS728]
MPSVYRSFLFVPGARQDRFAKAVAAGADAAIIDLEDAVLPGEKDKARADVLAWVSAWDGKGLAVRINSPRTAHGCADIAAFAASGLLAKLDFIMVPKAETAVDLEIVAEALGVDIPLIAVMESGRALANVQSVAAKATGGMLFGGADFSASLGADLANWDAMLTARALVAAACGATGIPAYDVPYLDVKDPAGLTETTHKARLMGFSGRACIHPDQVALVNAAFTPSQAELAEAQAIIDALNAAQGGAVLHKGKLVDRPVILAAERVLSKAKSV